MSRHDKTQIVIKDTIASFVREYARDGKDLLEIGGHLGRQTLIYRDQFVDPGKIVIYGWKKFVAPEVLPELDFQKVDLATENFPDEPVTYDVIVCNQVFEDLKKYFHTTFGKLASIKTWRVFDSQCAKLIGTSQLCSISNWEAIYDALFRWKPCEGLCYQINDEISYQFRSFPTCRLTRDWSASVY